MQDTANPEQPLVERRRQPRLSYTEPIQYRSLLKPDEVFAGSLAQDLSAGGLKIASAVPFAKESRLVVLFPLPDPLQVIRAIAQVVWDRERPFASGYECGLRFIEITSEDRDSIAGFVERGVVSS